MSLANLTENKPKSILLCVDSGMLKGPIIVAKRLPHLTQEKAELFEKLGYYLMVDGKRTELTDIVEDE